MRNLPGSAGAAAPMGSRMPMSGALLALVLAAGCGGPQRVLDPAGPAAERIAGLWWIMLAIASAVCVGVAILLALAVRRAMSRGRGEAADDIDGRVLVWTGGVVVPVLVLFTVLVLSFRAGAEVYPRIEGDERAMVIEVVGHQYWWEVRYPGHGITTANEIHLPVGVPVLFRVSAPDVIHSFWIPQLQGKIDMIPGQVHTLRVVADEPGRFRGQCAEFCGEGHALMALWVTAMDPAGFERWVAEWESGAGREPAATGEAHARGREIFAAAGCAGCHAIPGAGGRPAAAHAAPDLTNLARRSTLAAGTLPNTREALRRWITAPEAVKPGSLMPGTPLAEPEMTALLDYLQSLR
jgi:cytochrome c oxidase subunit 2